jgi:hypothetical protein
MKKITLSLAFVAALAACGRAGKTDIVTVDTQPVATPAHLEVAEALTLQGYKFVLAATKNNTDQVLVNEAANNLEFQVGGTVCRTKILSKEDPTYPGEELGVLQVVCDSHGVRLTSSASCSPRYPEVQSHFEIADGQDAYVLDLVCRVKPV